jgi:putative long chain acyl-CoA synthase
LAVTALMLRPGATVTAADIGEALAHLVVGLPPDIVHVVPDLPLAATYRPMIGELRAAGVPKPGRTTWILDPATGQYKRLTAAVRARLEAAE